MPAKSRPSSGLRALEKMQKNILKEENNLIRQYERSIKLLQKEEKSLTSQLDKSRKSRVAAKAMRGKKPVKTMEATLTKKLTALQSELNQIMTGYKKMLASQKALAAFEKEWKNNSKMKAAKKSKTKSPKKKSMKKEKISKEDTAMPSFDEFSEHDSMMQEEATIL